MSTFSLEDLERYIARQYPAGARLLIETYSYQVPTISALAQGVSDTKTLNIQANADFCLLRVSHRAQIGSAQTISNKTAPYVRMLVTDSGSNKQFSNLAIDLENYSQNGNDANLLTYPKMIRGNSSLLVAVTNYAPTAETYTTLDIAFHGVLVQVVG